MRECKDDDVKDDGCTDTQLKVKRGAVGEPIEAGREVGDAGASHGAKTSKPRRTGSRKGEADDGSAPAGRPRSQGAKPDDSAAVAAPGLNAATGTSKSKASTKAAKPAKAKTSANGKATKDSGARQGTGTAKTEDQTTNVRAIIDQAEGADQYRADADCLAAVLSDLEFGWSVMPARDKRPTLKTWMPLTQQRFSPEQARKRQWPGVAIICGAISGRLVVLDIDGPEGRESIAGLEIPPTVTAHTPSGIHYYFRWPNDLELPGPRVGLLPHVDFRGEGSYVVGPPTVRSDRGIYRWDEGHAPGEVDIAPAPQWLVALLSSKPSGKPAAPTGETIPQGQRNDTLLSIAGSMRRKGCSEKAIEAALQEENLARCVPPLDRNEVGRIAASVMRYEPGETVSPPTPPAEEIDARIEAMFQQIEGDRSFDVWSEVPFMASLDAARLGKVKSKLKKLQGGALNLNDLQAAIREHRRSVVPQDNRRDSVLPTIMVNRQMSQVVDDIIETLAQANDPPSLFVRNASLVRLNHDEFGRPFIEDLDVDSLRGIVAKAAVFESARNDGTVRDVDPPEKAVRSVLRHIDWGFPVLRSIAEGPVVRPDGTVAEKPGHDPAMQVYLSLSYDHRDVRYPETPSDGDLRRARETILEVLCDFPFVDEASRSNAVALLLLPLVRHAFDGQVPLAVIDAPQAGTGKSLLAEVVSLVHTGRQTAVTVAPREDDEWRKRLTTIVKMGIPIVSIDNVDQPLDNASLAGLLTSGCWADRALGQNDMISRPHQATWLCTGNNISIGGDLIRRCYWIRLDAESSTPWLRDGFKHENLKGWVLERRAELLSALMTMTRAWYAAGCPTPDVPVLGSFEEWARVIGGIVQHAGVTGFLGNLNECREQKDDVAHEWEAFLVTWWDCFGQDPITVADLLDDMHKDPARTWIQVTPSDVLGDDDFPKAPRLGRALSRKIDVRFGPHGVHLRRERKNGNTKAYSWSVRMDNPPVKEPSSAPGIAEASGDVDSANVGDAGGAGDDSGATVAKRPPLRVV